MLHANTFLFASLFVMSICVAPMLFVAWQVRRGRISDLHMRHSHERYLPYSIAIIGGIAVEIVMFRFGAGPILQLVMLVSIVELTIMLFGTFVVHISLHTMAMSSIISATAIVFGVCSCCLC